MKIKTSTAIIVVIGVALIRRYVSVHSDDATLDPNIGRYTRFKDGDLQFWAQSANLGLGGWLSTKELFA